MSIPDFNVRSEYVGNATLSTYTFDFNITDLSQLLIAKADDAGIQDFEVRGTDTTDIVAATIDPLGGGTVQLLTNLATNHKLAIMLAADVPIQDFEFRSKGDFTIRQFEDALDEQSRFIQSQARILQRAVRLSDSLPDDELATFDPQIPFTTTDQGVLASASRIIAISDDGLGFQFGPTTTEIFDAEAAAVAAAVQAAADAAASAAAAIQAANDAIAAAAGSGAAGVAAAAALVSENNAAASAIASAASAAASAVSAAAALASEIAAALIVGGAFMDVLGTRAAPIAITGATGIPFTGIKYHTVYFVQGNGGPVTLAAVANIQAGTVLGQSIEFIGRSDVNTITIPDGSGLNTGGQTLILGAGTVARFVWDSFEWTLASTNGFA